ncbi:MAG: tRNA dihydrouridine(20/20a) synthase DusA, partial [Gammaproteobacteria bacterium]|nr:tRNA dihydrouridine(20/20a) synthase DusA [Gammaproteobacteria bacterium]
LVLQLGGSESDEFSKCAKIVEDYGYDEININVGCPSDRVQSGSFGACLMKTPDTVAKCVESLKKNTHLPVSIKCRIGVDDIESYKNLHNFVRINRDAGCKIFYIHARKAWLKGLSPKENRDIPPLNYEWVFQIKKDFPELVVSLNGGLQNLEDSYDIFKKLDGVMLGRKAYHEPFILSKVDEIFYEKKPNTITRESVLERFVEYMKKEISKGVNLRSMTRHILGLYHSQPNSKKFKQLLSGKNIYLEDLEKWLIESRS